MWQACDDKGDMMKTPQVSEERSEGRTPLACSLAMLPPSSRPAAYISSLASTSQPSSSCRPCQQQSRVSARAWAGIVPG